MLNAASASWRSLVAAGALVVVSGDLVCARPGLVLAQPQFTQRQQRQVRQSGFGILGQELLQHLRCLREFVLRQG